MQTQTLDNVLKLLIMASKGDIEFAWENAHKMHGKDPDLWRKDDHGNVIFKRSYGTRGEYGWEIDHKNPKAKGGSDHRRNLRALHHNSNRKKSDKYPHR